MKRRENFFSGVLTAICVLLLTACGGGGSGDDGGKGGGDNPPPLDPGPVPSYSGSTEPAQIDRDSALEVAQLAIESTSVVPMVESLWVDIPDNITDTTETVNGSGGGSAEITVSGGNKVTTTFREFTESGQTLNGTLEQTVDTSAPDWWSGGFPSRIAGTMQFDRLELTGSGQRFMLHGSVEGDTYTKLIFNLLLQDNTADESVKLEDFVVGWEKLPSEVEGYPERDTGYLSGTVYDSGLGRVDIFTSKQFQEMTFDDTGMLYGTGNGIVDISGSGAGLQLAVMNRRYAAILMDEDRNGGYETGMRVEWRQLFGLEPFQPPETDVLPVANTGPDLQTGVEVPTFVHALFSHGSDGRFLSYRWELLDLPYFADDAPFQDSDSAYFQFVPRVSGEYLLGLTVSDGEHSSRSTIRVKVWQDRQDLGIFYTPAQETVGELEISASTDKTEYTIDGRSVLYDDEGDLGISVSNSEKPFVLDQDSGNPLRTLYNADGLAGMARITALISNSDFNDTQLNVGLGRYERHVNKELRSDGIFDLVTAEFGSGRNADILYLAFQDATANDLVPYLTLLAQDDSTRPVRLKWRNRVPAGNTGLTLGDLNGDGWQDVITVGEQYAVAEEDVGIYVSLQTQGEGGKRSLGQPQIYPFYPDVDPSAHPCDLSRNFQNLSVGDFDGDGEPDLLAFKGCRDFPAKVIVWRGLGEGQLADPELHELDLGDTGGADFADFDGDGRVDLAVTQCFDSCAAASNTSELLVYFNQPDGFSRVQVLDDPEYGHPKVTAGDFNGDGRVDLVYSDSFKNPEISGSRIFFQQDDGSFAQGPFFHGAYAEQGGFRWTDLNGDGTIDLILRGGGYMLNLKFNNGDGSYTEAGLSYDPLEVTGGSRVSVADMDADGELDIVLPSGQGFHTLFSDLHPYPVPVATENQ